MHGFKSFVITQQTLIKLMIGRMNAGRKRNDEDDKLRRHTRWEKFNLMSERMPPVLCRVFACIGCRLFKRGVTDFLLLDCHP